MIIHHPKKNTPEIVAKEALFCAFQGLLGLRASRAHVHTKWCHDAVGQKSITNWDGWNTVITRRLILSTGLPRDLLYQQCHPKAYLQKSKNLSVGPLLLRHLQCLNVPSACWDYFRAKHASTHTTKICQGANSLVAWDIWRRTLKDRLNHWSTSAKCQRTRSRSFILKWKG